MLALGLAAWCLRVRLKIPFPLKALVRILFSSSTALVFASLFDVVGLWAVFVRALIAGVTFLLVLVLSRELTRGDWELVLSTLSRRKVS